MSIRSDFADALRGALPPTDRVVDHAYALDGIEPGRPVVMLERTRIEHAPNLGGYFARFNVHVISPVTGAHTADDELDDTTDRVVAAIDGWEWVHWETATRSTFLELYPSFLIEATVYADKLKGL